MAEQASALRGAMEEMREIVATLRTDTTAFDLQGALRSMAAQVASSGSLHVEVQTPETPVPLSAHRQYHLARVIQEALTNCLRHSGAAAAKVEVRLVDTPVGPKRVVAVVSDEGAGFDPAASDGRPHHGLQGMAERLAPYDGKVVVDSAPGKGTRVTAELPGDLNAW